MVRFRLLELRASEVPIVELPAIDLRAFRRKEIDDAKGERDGFDM